MNLITISTIFGVVSIILHLLHWHSRFKGNNTWYWSVGDGNFLKSTHLEIPAANIVGKDLYVVSINGNEVPDYLFYDNATGQTTFYTDQSLLQSITGISAADIDGGEGIQMGDWNGDGRTDFVW